MTTRGRLLIAGVVAVLVLAVGLLYTFTRTEQHASTARLVLVPTPADPGDVPSLIGTFDASGSIGTYVEMVDSVDVFQAAGAPPVELAVRAVPDTRVITVTATGAAADVQPALNRIIAIVERRQAQLRDAWTLETLQRPDAPEASGPGTAVLAVASIALALIAGAFVLVVLVRVAPPQGIGPAGPDGRTTAAHAAGGRPADDRW